MDNRPPEQQPIPISPERQQQIDAIVKRDHKAFAEWVTANPDQPRLDLPPDATRYFIPRRLLELTDNPERVQIRMATSEKQELAFFIVEEMPQPISDNQSLLQFHEAFKKYQYSDYSTPKPKIPDNIDPKHGTYIDDLEKAGIATHDKILLVMQLGQIGRDELFVRQYDDRDELRGQGVATSAYARLSKIALDLNERYVTGRNRGENGKRKRVDFFLNKLGRIRFSDLQGDLREKFWERHNLKLNDDYMQFADQFTITFLHQAEKPIIDSSHAS